MSDSCAPGGDSDRDGRPAVHVAVGAVLDRAGRVLIARRPPHAHQGDLWEFPGGKVDPGEDVRAALYREFLEEVGIALHEARPLIRVDHAYADRRVLLDVWLSERFSGTPWGREGQAVKWAVPEELKVKDFPAANRPIIDALRLPDLYAVSDEPRAGTAAFLHRLERVLAGGIRLVQLRAKTLDEENYRRLAAAAARLCRRHGARLLLNAPPAWAETVDADGLHLTARRLLAAAARPVDRDRWLAASCHSAAEAAHARRIGVDFIVAGPVLATASHPGAPAMGWEGLHAMTAAAGVPVYALGGMGRRHLPEAWRHGARGIAAITGLWNCA